MQFISTDLRERYGKQTFKVDRGTIPRESVPEEYRDPDRAFQVKHEDTAVIGTNEELWNAEQAEREASSEEMSTQAVTSYTGPLYVYEEDEDGGGLGEATGPINVGWDNGLGWNSSQIASYMQDRGWESWWRWEGDRYVLMHYSSGIESEKADENIKKSVGTSPSTQYHIRTYNIASYVDDDVLVWGQAHKDPWDHGEWQDTDWSFFESRAEVQDDWLSWGADSVDIRVNNTSYGSRDFESSNGWLAMISN